MIGAQGVSRKSKRCPNGVFVRPRVRLKDSFDCFSSGQFLQNQLDGNACACDNGLSHHHAGIGNDYFSVIPQISLSNQPNASHERSPSGSANILLAAIRMAEDAPTPRNRHYGNARLFLGPSYAYTLRRKCSG